MLVKTSPMIVVDPPKGRRIMSIRSIAENSTSWFSAMEGVVGEVEAL